MEELLKFTRPELKLTYLSILSIFDTAFVLYLFVVRILKETPMSSFTAQIINVQGKSSKDTSN